MCRMRCRRMTQGSVVTRGHYYTILQQASSCRETGNDCSGLRSCCFDQPDVSQIRIAVYTASSRNFLGPQNHIFRAVGFFLSGTWEVLHGNSFCCFDQPDVTRILIAAYTASNRKFAGPEKQTQIQRTLPGQPNGVTARKFSFKCMFVH